MEYEKRVTKWYILDNNIELYQVLFCGDREKIEKIWALLKKYKLASGLALATKRSKKHPVNV